MPLPFQRRGGAQLRPTFSRDFAGLKTLDHGAGPSINFTRASNATFFDASGVLQTASNDQPRFDHSGGTSLGLLIEEARTNVIPASSALTNATYWSVDAGVTRTANAAVAPDGTNTATRVVFTTANEALYRNATSDVGGVGTFTATFFVKAGAAGQIGATINVGTGNGTDGFTDVAVTLTDQWQRVSATKTTALSADRYISVNNSNSATATDVLVWGAQLEQGAFPTSYIPTTTAAATRSADSAVVTPISSFYNQSEGTLFGEIVYSTAQTNSTANYYGNIIRINSVSSNLPNIEYYAQIQSTGTNLGQAIKLADSANVIQAEVGFNDSISRGQTYKYAAGFAANNVATFRNGVAGVTDASVDMTLMGPISRMCIGMAVSADGGLSNFLNGHIRKIAYWPKRLSNTLLQQITT